MSSPTSTDPGPTEPIEAPETEGAESGRAARVVRFVRDRKLLVAGISVGLVAVVLLGAYLARGDRAADDHGHAHDAEAGDGTPTVTFLMEQQWLVEMKFETVEATQVARQVTTTGRVVPA